MPVSTEDNLKLVLAYSIFSGDADKAAKYMGITKNAAGIRFAKLMRDEKKTATELGFLESGEALTKKRPASGGGRAAKKTKTKVTENGSDTDNKEKGWKDDGGSD